MSDDSSDQQAQAFPPPHRVAIGAPQPFLTFMILAINTIVFLAISYESQSIMLPRTEVLLRYGAKDAFTMVSGEYWRFVTPMFIHIGVVHFALNSFALYYIGRQIEVLVGTRWFLFIYLAAGVGGVAASSVFTVGLSAGASGAIFGLLGVGFLFERIVAFRHKQETGQRLRGGPYTGLVVVNVLIGFIVSSGDVVGIDNAAHLGGLFTGVGLTFAMLFVKPNRLIRQNRRYTYVLVAAVCSLIIGLAYLGSDRGFVVERLAYELRGAESPAKRLRIYSELVKIDAEQSDWRFQRGRLLILNHQLRDALTDFAPLLNDPAYAEQFRSLVAELNAAGMPDEAFALERAVSLPR